LGSKKKCSSKTATFTSGFGVKLVLVTDAWTPQVNGVVTTLVELVREMQKLGHTVEVIHPSLFRTRSCSGYAGIDLAIRPKKKITELLNQFHADAIHIATEGPLGWAARGYCLKYGLSFTSAFHTKFPEILNAALKIPLSWGYELFRHFHKASSGVMVPTQGVLNMLKKRGFVNLRQWTHGVDTELFSYHSITSLYLPFEHLEHPISLFVGRISYEKNIAAFLNLNMPGTKVVCGVGPLELGLKKQYPKVRWLGLLSREELAKVYAAADVFVFPSQSETFGLVLLEAMACGTPVAAYPVDGPLEVLCDTAGKPYGGVLNVDLLAATRQALAIPRIEARNRAVQFSWSNSAKIFEKNLVAAKVVSLHLDSDKIGTDLKLSKSSKLFKI
jgi:glycosyltransferase involved in cell wall biosynthesis